MRKPSRGLPPTRWVGESGVISSGCSVFELLQLNHELVEFGVVNFGIVEDVVAVFVVADFFAQCFDLLFGSLGRGRHD